MRVRLTRLPDEKQQGPQSCLSHRQEVTSPELYTDPAWVVYIQRTYHCSVPKGIRMDFKKTVKVIIQ